jgi:hypothetical protein
MQSFCTLLHSKPLSFSFFRFFINISGLKSHASMYKPTWYDSSKMRSHIHIFAFLIQSLFWVTAQTAELCTHDHSFIPDAVLRVTAANLSQSCYPAKETILVNGTSPGPELRLTEGKTYWIRVYNDMLDANLTMVSHT